MRGRKQRRQHSSLPESSEQLSTVSPHVSDFLFVNRDQASIGCGTRCHVVNSHVQVSSRKRSLELRESSEVKAPKSPLTKTAVGLRKEGIVQPWRANRPQRPQRASDHVETSGDETARSSLQSAKLSIQKGNSDPFAALPFTVGPITNRILSWFRDDGIPSLFPMEKAVLGLRMPAAQRKWERGIKSVQSPTLAHPYLASVCGMMARLTRSDIIRIVALQLKGKCYTILRTHLGRTDRPDVDETWRIILHMFWAEQNTGCQRAAEAHLVSLAEYLKGEQVSSLDADFRMELLAADVVLAGMNMGLPLFRGPKWATEGMYEDWRSEVDYDAKVMLALNFLEVPEGVRDGRLRSILIRLRELVAVAELVASQEIRHYSVYRWMDFRLLACESGLLALCHEYSSHFLEGMPNTSAASRSSSMDYCACLTALAWTCSTFGSSNRCMDQIMASRLRVVQLGCGFDELGHGESRELALWSFYVGSLLERRNQYVTGDSTSHGWHKTNFELVAKTIEDGRQQSVSQVLDKFLHSGALKVFGLS